VVRARPVRLRRVAFTTSAVVVVVFVQIYPETKKRQFKQALDAYELAAGQQAMAGRGQATGKAGVVEGPG